MTYGTKPLAEQRPGAFKSFCRLSAWVDAAEVLADNPMPEGTVRERWNRKTNRNELLMQCDVTFTDAATFEAHMADVHQKTTRDQIDLDSCAYRPIKCRSATPSSGGDGKPFKASTKTIGDRLHTCPSCGLIAEVGYVHGSQLWFDEHVRGCKLALAGAAS